MPRAQLTGIEYYLPQILLGNEELARLYPEWPAAQIEAKTGIRTRHVAAPGETAADMAVQAAKKLFATGKCTPDEIDFLLLCTESPDYFLPPSACLIQHQLNVPKSAGAFDYNLACSGYVYGLAVAQGLIETGAARTVLLLTAETYSKFMHPLDKSVRTLFGDGAAATVIRGVEGQPDASPWIGPFVFGTDGSGAETLIVKCGASRCRQVPENAHAQGPDATGRFPDSYLFMDGPAIFSFTLKTVSTAVKDLLQKIDLPLEAVDLFVFHQANQFMLEALRKQLKIPRERFVISLAEKGNTVSSTIPMALLDAQRDGQLKPGQRVMVVGFGVGLSWAAGLVTWIGI